MKFSVSMCVYGKDNPQWFATAVNSILYQTVKPDEVVLVVDGPVPEELDGIICGYEKNPVFRVIRLEKNMGHGEARRVGLNACTHDLVALMDADDISAPDRFEKQLEAFRSDESLTMIGGRISEFVGEESNIVSYRDVCREDAAIKEDMKKH